jgi:hypothetical protein
MASSRLFLRSSRALLTLSRSTRPFSISASRSNEFEALNKRAQDTAEEYRKYQTSKPLNPHFTNTTSTIANEMPSVGKDAPPPELITNVDGEFAPKDAVPENTERMTGGTQSSQSADVSGSNKGLKGDVEGKGELGVGEMEGATFKVEPLRRTGEDDATMKARLLCPFPTGLTTRCHSTSKLEAMRTQPLTILQIRAGNGERSKVSSSCPPSPTPISPP